MRPQYIDRLEDYTFDINLCQQSNSLLLVAGYISDKIKIRDRSGEWKKLHQFLDGPSLLFSHGMCNDCLHEHY